MHSATLDLHEWHEFYLLVGTAAAALLALLFVAVSIGVGFFTRNRTAGTQIFISPIVAHFSSLLFISAVTLTPVKSPLLIECVIGANALVGIIAALVILASVMRSDYDSVVLTDHFAYGAGPGLAYVLILASMILSYRGYEWALHFLAAGVLLLLLVNIRNAWDTILTVVRRQGEHSDS